MNYFSHISCSYESQFVSQLPHILISHSITAVDNRHVNFVNSSYQLFVKSHSLTVRDNWRITVETLAIFLNEWLCACWKWELIAWSSKHFEVQVDFRLWFVYLFYWSDRINGEYFSFLVRLKQVLISVSAIASLLPLISLLYKLHCNWETVCVTWEPSYFRKTRN